MFTLITGKPGAGKTSNALAMLQDKKYQGRPIYYRGITDLSLDWKELSDTETQNWDQHLPDNAVLIVDEAQQIWPVRSPAKPVPPGLTALETHRHHGWDVFFITQDPGLLDSHARRIANEHYHFERPFGAPYVNQYHSGTGAFNPATKSELANTIKTKKKLPKAVWGLYKSAEAHTHKFRPPKLLIIFPFLILIPVLLVWWFFSSFLGGKQPTDQYPSDIPTDADIPGYRPSPAVHIQRLTWAESFKPEIPGLPYTAPLYEEEARKPRSIPIVHGCYSFEPDLSDCRCTTQQGTQIRDMSLAMCQDVLRYGLFNHLASDETEGQRRRGSDAEARGTERAAGWQETSL